MTNTVAAYLRTSCCLWPSGPHSAKMVQGARSAQRTSREVGTLWAPHARNGMSLSSLGRTCRTMRGRPPSSSVSNDWPMTLSLRFGPTGRTSGMSRPARMAQHYTELVTTIGKSGGSRGP